MEQFKKQFKQQFKKKHPEAGQILVYLYFLVVEGFGLLLGFLESFFIFILFYFFLL